MTTRVDLDRVRVEIDGVMVLDEVTVSWSEQRVGIVGANGSGKSTLLRLLNGLQVATAGSVTVRVAVGDLAPGSATGCLAIDPARDPRAARAHVGFVFTDPGAQIVMPTPAEDVALSLRRLRLPREELRARVQAVLADAGLADRADDSSFALSSGQKQLLAIASVLAVDPDVVVFDEPTTLLDLANSAAVERRIAGLDQAVVIASHDLPLIERLCERVLVLDGGRVVADGPADRAVAAYRDLVVTGRGPG